jgi:hypothetical protein
MKTYALVGSHGAGKTTVFEEIKNRYPEFIYFSEGVRHQVEAFGYKTPYQITNMVGIGIFEVMNINSWSVIDPDINTVLDEDMTIVTDRSAVDNFAYYLTLRDKPVDYACECLIKDMAKHYVSLVDGFFYFPTGVVSLKKDTMRPGSKKYQKLVDANIKKAFKILEVPASKIHKVKSKSTNNRADEILEIILKNKSTRNS